MAENILLHYAGNMFIDITQVTQSPTPGSSRTNQDEESLDSIHHYFSHLRTKLVLPVLDDAMADAGIYQGDYAIAEKNREPEEGNIVAYLLDGNYGIGMLQVNKMGELFIQHSNYDYEDIYVQGELEVIGVVTSTIRRFSSLH